MSAFEEFWNVEEDSDGDYENMKHFAKTYWDAAIKFKEAGEQRPTEQSEEKGLCGKIGKIIAKHLNADIPENVATRTCLYDPIMEEIRPLFNAPTKKIRKR